MPESDSIGASKGAAENGKNCETSKQAVHWKASDFDRNKLFADIRG